MPFPNVSEPFSRALEARGYTEPTDVQHAVLADEAIARDLLVSAQTGSGKTVAYGLAMAGTLLNDADSLPPADVPLALIIAPTRELALQVQTELTWLYAHTGAKIVSCVGGMDPVRESRLLERGVHIVVGTPGRLRDHMERGRLHLEALKCVVIDEADEMLDLGFHDDLEFLLQATPEDRQTFLFSATLPRPIVKLAQNYQQNAMRIAIAAADGGHADIEYRAVRIAHAKLDRAVVNLLRHIDPPCAIVFCATRAAVTRLGETLAARGFDAVALSGEMTQNERNRALAALREGRAKVCVATDVAARGLDVAHLSLVIHADLPKNAEILQHRSGRTGRAGRKGVSILLVPPSRRHSAETLLMRARVQYTWMQAPTPQEIYAMDGERLLHGPLLQEPGDYDDNALADALAGRFPPDRLALALARLYRARLPVPEDLEAYVEEPGRGERNAERDGERTSNRRERTPRAAKEGFTDRPPREKPARTKKTRTSADGVDPKAREHGLGEGAVWFRVGVGRSCNADPNWLLPEICRQGDVTKKDIGEIRIFEDETRFEVDAQVAEDFAAKAQARERGGILIYPAFGGEPDNSPLPRAMREAPVEAPEGAESDTPRPPRKPRTNARRPAHGSDGETRAKPTRAPRAKTPPDPDRKQKRKERKKEKRRLAALTKTK